MVCLPFFGIVSGEFLSCQETEDIGFVNLDVGAEMGVQKNGDAARGGIEMMRRSGGNWCGGVVWWCFGER